MEKKCNLKETWKIQIEKDIYEIIYEGFYDERSHYLTINGVKSQIDIPVEIRSRKYDRNPYEYVFEIDELSLTLFLTEEYVLLVTQGIDVKSCMKYELYERWNKTGTKLDIIVLIALSIFFWGTYFEVDTAVTIYTTGALMIIVCLVKWYLKIKYGKIITWVKDEKRSIIQFKKDFDKIMGL